MRVSHHNLVLPRRARIPSPPADGAPARNGKVGHGADPAIISSPVSPHKNVPRATSRRESHREYFGRENVCQALACCSASETKVLTAKLPNGKYIPSHLRARLDSLNKLVSHARAGPTYLRWAFLQGTQADATWPFAFLAGLGGSKAEGLVEAVAWLVGANVGWAPIEG